MRRSVLAFALFAGCVLFTAPVSAQVRNHSWFANAGIGPAFGTLGSTPAVDALRATCRSLAERLATDLLSR